MGDDNWKRQEKLMSPNTIAAICHSLQQIILAQSRRFNVVLHGGEPLLLGPEKLSFLLQELRQVLPLDYPISIQTNGVLITEELLDICHHYATTMAVSLDGPEHVHDKYRLTHHQQGSFHAVMKGLRILQAHPAAKEMYAGLLAVVEPLSDPAVVYQFFKEVGTPSVDFLYRDGNHTRLPAGKRSPDSVEFGSWMIRLLDTYLNDPDPLPIRVLDDMMKVLLGGAVSKEGTGVTDFAIVIIDTDGTIMKNDTLKSTYNGADKFSRPYNIKNHDLVDFLRSEEFQTYREMQRPNCQICQQCPELAVCGGGMILHRWKETTGFNNPSIYCADQLLLIRHIRTVLATFAKQYA